jgi:hypothetical protein
MFWLDRMLVKLYASGHRVLLFSTMTKMLDTVEFYLNWREVRESFQMISNSIQQRRQGTLMTVVKSDRFVRLEEARVGQYAAWVHMMRMAPAILT